MDERLKNQSFLLTPNTHTRKAENDAVHIHFH